METFIVDGVRSPMGMKNGNLIDSGSHDYLINNCEDYKSLYKKQLK